MTTYFVTLACFSVILIYPDSLFRYFTIVILSVIIAATFPLRPPRLAFAICGWRGQNDAHEIKYSVCVCLFVSLHISDHITQMIYSEMMIKNYVW